MERTEKTMKWDLVIFPTESRIFLEVFLTKVLACNFPGSDPIAVTIAAVKTKARVMVGLRKYYI